MQQIFWQRLASVLQEPTQPEPYLNTLFAVFNARDVPLDCLLGIINSRFVSGSYERRANRLFGDKFPKVSKADLASIPIPRMSSATIMKIGESARILQGAWQAMRDALQTADEQLGGLRNGLRLKNLGEAWALSEREFREGVSDIGGGSLTTIETAELKTIYRHMKSAVDSNWATIQESEFKLEALVQKAYRVSKSIYQEIVDVSPVGSVEWAMRA